MQLALEIPGASGRIQGNPATKYTPAGFQLSDAINDFLEVAIYVGAFLMFFWIIWGVFDYIKAEGNKEALAKARKRIQWAIAGFVILIMAFFISDILKDILVGTRGILRPSVPLSF